VRIRKSRRRTNSRSERTLESQESILSDSGVGVVPNQFENNSYCGWDWWSYY